MPSRLQTATIVLGGAAMAIGIFLWRSSETFFAGLKPPHTTSIGRPGGSGPTDVKAEREFTVATNSMGPGILGKHVDAQCPKCLRSFAIAAEMRHSSWPSPCPICGSECEVNETIIAGDSVRIATFDTRTSMRLRRFDIVAIDTAELGDAPSSNAPVLKRIWGLPGEQPRIAAGEMWVDGKMIHKSLRFLRELAVPVHSWTGNQDENSNGPSVAEAFSEPSGDGISQYSWSPAEGPRGLSDDSILNQGASYLPSRTNDILVNLDIEPAWRQPGRWLAVSWDYGGKRRTAILISRDRQGNLTSNSNLPSRPSLGSLAGAQQVELTATRRIEIAWCDGCLSLAQDGQLDLDRRPYASKDGQIDLGHVPQTAMPGKLIVQYSDGEAGLAAIEKIVVSRDIILRSRSREPWRSETFDALLEDEVFVLGDNQPISSDSRTVGSIKTEQIIGRLKQDNRPTLSTDQ